MALAGGAAGRGGLSSQGAMSGGRSAQHPVATGAVGERRLEFLPKGTAARKSGPSEGQTGQARGSGVPG